MHDIQDYDNYIGINSMATSDIEAIQFKKMVGDQETMTTKC